MHHLPTKYRRFGTAYTTHILGPALVYSLPSDLELCVPCPSPSLKAFWPARIQAWMVDSMKVISTEIIFAHFIYVSVSQSVWKNDHVRQQLTGVWLKKKFYCQISLGNVAENGNKDIGVWRDRMRSPANPPPKNCKTGQNCRAQLISENQPKAPNTPRRIY